MLRRSSGLHKLPGANPQLWKLLSDPNPLGITTIATITRFIINSMWIQRWLGEITNQGLPFLFPHLVQRLWLWGRNFRDFNGHNHGKREYSRKLPRGEEMSFYMPPSCLLCTYAHSWGLWYRSGFRLTLRAFQASPEIYRLVWNSFGGSGSTASRNRARNETF